MPHLSETWIGGCPPLGLFQSPGLKWWGEESWWILKTVFYQYLLLFSFYFFPLFIFKYIHSDSCLLWLSSLCQPQQRLFLARWSCRFWFPGDYSNCPSIQVVFKFGYGPLYWWLIKEMDHRSHYWRYFYLKEKKYIILLFFIGRKRGMFWKYTHFSPSQLVREWHGSSWGNHNAAKSQTLLS